MRARSFVGAPYFFEVGLGSLRGTVRRPGAAMRRLGRPRSRTREIQRSASDRRLGPARRTAEASRIDRPDARLVCLVVIGLVSASLLAASRAGAQLTSAEMYVDLQAGVSASDEGVPSETDSFSDGPRTTDIFLASGSIPWNLAVTAGGGTASTEAVIEYLATTTSQIFLRGDFAMSAFGAPPAAALAGFDAVVSIHFQVATETTMSLAGYVSTGRDLGGPEVVACQIDGQVLAGDSRATPLPAGSYPILDERVLFPGETAVLECSANSSGGTADTNSLVWEVQVNGLPEPEAMAQALAALGALGPFARRRGVAVTR